MVFDDICKQLLSNLSETNLLINQKKISFPYSENDASDVLRDLIELEKLIILKLQNPELEIDISLRGKLVEDFIPESECVFLSLVKDEK